MRVDGIINLDKPANLTSTRAVTEVKLLLGGLNKVGHAGTLDPFATGVLLILIGRATKACEQLMGAPKTYDAVIYLGATTPTDDVDSQATAWPGAKTVPLDLVENTLAGFVGDIPQRPPAYSAMKVGGKRAYALARDGRAPKLSTRSVHIDSLELISYNWPSLTVRVRCGRGTYVRSLARDIGEQLNVGGFLQALRRTGVGKFDVSSAVSLERLTRDGIAAHLQRVPELSSAPSAPE